MSPCVAGKTDFMYSNGSSKYTNLRLPLPADGKRDRMAHCVYVCLLTVNVLVVCIVLHDGPDRRCLATCLEHRGLGYDVQPCRCSREATAQNKDCPDTQYI